MSLEHDRIDYIDILRGIGILLMVMGHTNSFGGYFDKFIHAFHVPMFFLISGYLFKAKFYTLPMIIKKRMKTLLIPYFVFGGIHIVRIVLIEKALRFEYIENYLLWSKEGMPVPGTCWFLMVMFWADIIYAVINTKISGQKQHVAVILVMCLGMSFQFIKVKILWGLDSALVAVGLMHLGQLAKEFHNNVWIRKAMSLNISEIIVCGVIQTCVIFLTPYINMRTANYGVWPLFVVDAVGACFIGVSISKILEYHGTFCKMVAYLKHVGKKSIVYLCCNQLLIESMREYISVKNTYLKGIILLIATCVMIEIICCIIYNTRLKIVIGR